MSNPVGGQTKDAEEEVTELRGRMMKNTVKKPGTVGLRNARMGNKPRTDFVIAFHELCLSWCPVLY